MIKPSIKNKKEDLGLFKGLSSKWNLVAR
jgi:hypothetical protein